MAEYNLKKKTIWFVIWVLTVLALCKCGGGLQTGDAVSGAFQNLKDAVTPNK
jgi:hypothetical protein